MHSFDSIGFIGGGRVTRFLLEGWRRAGRMAERIRASDPAPDVRTGLKRDFPGIETTDNAGAAGAALVVLAVHPPALKEILPAMSRAIVPGVAVLSLAPKVPLAAIQGALGVPAVARMIPNAPSALGEGFNPVVYGPDMPAETRGALAALFAPWGQCPEVPEADLEAYAILSAMGPTYLWFQWQTLRELGVGFGLTPEAADRAMRAMVRGAADLLFGGEFNPAAVMDMVPVKPLKDDEAAIAAAYKTRLPALFAKIRP